MKRALVGMIAALAAVSPANATFAIDVGPAGKPKPSDHLLATQDRMIPPAAQRVMAADRTK
ncbi:hypothetical protein [Nitrospirillum iridis]|uniref:Uncharacterized protein n=1 Tax=Nitrospirillum iridis TaxID=765888 RepID=A0A7X0B287_9PROT|nr:hypothetical protein [Nitrospirillum iridis]MBB6254403.1 hypothetical protein [Nitrospirillum iridis]